MVLECHNISFKYPQSENDVFHNLSYKISEPGFNALFGPSGIGKTSFAKIITGMIRDYKGTINDEGLSTLLYTYNLERLPDWSSIGTHLKKIIPSDKNNQKEKLIDLFGINEIMGQRFSQLSLGQKNRINLIRYLLQDFDLLIMDESLANVDEITREKIILNIKKMFPEKFFLYISHNIIEVSKFCKEILVFRSTHKKPQTVSVNGQNLQLDEKIEKELLEKTMLEIMNVS
ncbi:MAG: ATP-binding cassette domain-containing protein [Desulfobacterales bacterium]|nr:ATP-binding cassette domain-containing protein [Desulfobacterales bacterium]